MSIPVKFYINGARKARVTFVRSRRHSRHFSLGNFAYFNGDTFGLVTGVGMEGKCLAVHIREVHNT